MRAKGFGMKVIAYDPYIPHGQELALQVDRVHSLEELLSSADFVSIHSPLSDETHHLINKAAVSKMKEGAVLVNTARGGICDLDAIYDGLKSGRIGAAGLDVFEHEPPADTHPLITAWRAREDWLEGRFVATPHSAFFSPTSSRELREKAITTCIDRLENGRLRNCVNLEFLKTG